MSYTLSNRVEVSLYINDQEYPLDTNNVIDFLHIGSTTKAILPQIHIGLTDQTHALDKLELQDAIPIRVAIKGYGAPTVTYNFRKFDHRRDYNGACYVYQFDGYWDAPLYWAGTSLAGYRGASNDVLQQVAQACGLKYSGTSTSDTQLWMQRNRTYGEFTRRVAAHGFINDKSYMVACVDLNGTLLYKDANNLPTAQLVVVANQLVDGAYTCMDASATAASGLNNKVTGYNYSHFDQSMAGATAQTEHATLAFTPDSRSPLFNTTMKNAAGRGMISYAPIDVGNTHEMYQRAKYQNRRYANLYNLDVEFLMPQPTTLDLLKTYTFSSVDENDRKDIANSGDYTVAARSILIQGTQYGEKIVGTRHGTNANYTTG